MTIDLVSKIIIKKLVITHWNSQTKKMVISGCVFLPFIVVLINIVLVTTSIAHYHHHQHNKILSNILTTFVFVNELGWWALPYYLYHSNIFFHFFHFDGKNKNSYVWAMKKMSCNLALLTHISPPFFWASIQ
jgi:hypothetical protein